MLHHPRSGIRESSSQRGRPPSHDALACTQQQGKRLRLRFTAFFGFWRRKQIDKEETGKDVQED
jgi:hypothetical protein